MQDGPLRALVKTLVRWMWTAEFRLRRLPTTPRWELTGACQSCGACCERPSIKANLATWYLPITRRLFLAWQRHVNGFELIEAERPTKTFVFRCTHFDWAARRCDSYATRPFMCRDYPRILLDQAWPELFDGCGHGLRDGQGNALAQALDDADLTSEQRQDLRRRLRLD